jgi:hypothetical protein
MADRILTWQCFQANGNKYHIGPTYYLEADYAPLAVRIVAEHAPDVDDAQFNIYDDGTSIFVDNAHVYRHTRTGQIESDGAETEIPLHKDESSEPYAEDFIEDSILEQGSWISCNIIKDGGGRNFTVHLELEKQTDTQEDVTTAD